MDLAGFLTRASSALTAFPERNSSGFPVDASALTVAGQWRTFTAFPNILMIVVVAHPPAIEQTSCHELLLDDIHSYKIPHP